MTRRRSAHHFCQGVVLVLLSCVLVHPVYALEWSRTELHLQYGKPGCADFCRRRRCGTFYLYAATWPVDGNTGTTIFLSTRLTPRIRSFRISTSMASGTRTFSLGKITGRKVGAGIVSDVGVILGFNWARKPGIKKYLPGLRLSLDLPGFTFANLDFTAYIDDSEGVSSGGAPSESDSFMIDFNFMRPFKIGEADFSLEGHAEYIGGRKNQFGDTVESWILAQPQLRWNAHDRFSLGIEYQYWMNKLGDGATDESVVQTLFVWKF